MRDSANLPTGGTVPKAHSVFRDPQNVLILMYFKIRRKNENDKNEYATGL